MGDAGGHRRRDVHRRLFHHGQLRRLRHLPRYHAGPAVRAHHARRARYPAGVPAGGEPPRGGGGPDRGIARAAGPHRSGHPGRPARLSPSPEQLRGEPRHAPRRSGRRRLGSAPTRAHWITPCSRPGWSLATWCHTRPAANARARCSTACPRAPARHAPSSGTYRRHLAAHASPPRLRRSSRPSPRPSRPSTAGSMEVPPPAGTSTVPASTPAVRVPGWQTTPTSRGRSPHCTTSTDA